MPQPFTTNKNHLLPFCPVTLTFNPKLTLINPTTCFPQWDTQEIILNVHFLSRQETNHPACLQNRKIILFVRTLCWKC